MPKKGQGTYDAVYLPPWEYMAGQTVAGSGASAAVTIPDGAEIFQISAEGGAVYYAMNAGFAQSDSPGYVPEDGLRIEGPLSNLNSLHVWAAGGVSAHIEFFQEA